MAGPRTGNQRCLNRPHLVRPAGRRDNCSSHVGSNCATTGSTNRIMRERLNHTCATTRAVKWPGCGQPVADEIHPNTPVSPLRSRPRLCSTPPGEVKAKKPTAATTGGVTNGRKRRARLSRMFLHWYLPKAQASGKPITTVRALETEAWMSENRKASMAPGCSCTVVSAPNGVMPVTDHKRIKASETGKSPRPMTNTTANQCVKGTPAKRVFHSIDMNFSLLGGFTPLGNPGFHFICNPFVADLCVEGRRVGVMSEARSFRPCSVD